MLRNRHTTGRRIAVGGVAAATALGLTLMTTSPGAAAQQNPNEDAEALGQLIESDLFKGQLLDIASAYSSAPGSIDAESTPLDVDALNALKIDLGDGISLPLASEPDGGGLLEIGNAGTLNAFGHASEYNNALASAGAVGTDGALNIDDVNAGKYGNANVNLTTLFEQLGVEGVTNEIVDDLSLELGAIASTANSDGNANNSEYVVADGKLTVSSPAVEKLSSAVTTTIDGAGGTLQEVLGNEGLASKLAAVGIDLNVLAARVQVGGSDAEISVEVRDALNGVVAEVINEELTDDNRLVSVNLETGKIAIDLAKIVKGKDAEDLNGLAPNTQVLTDDTISTITTAVAEAIGSLAERANIALAGDPDAPEDSAESKGALDDFHVIIKLPASISLLGSTVTGGVTVDATLGQLAGNDPTPPKIATDLKIGSINAGQVLNLITTPVINAVLNITKPLVAGILDATADEISGAITGLVDPLLASLKPVFENLKNVVDLTINEQPTAKDEESQVKGNGSNGDGFTVSAVSLELLPNALSRAAVADINLASSSVRAVPEAAPGDANANASAAAAASADADGNDNAVAEAASEAAANNDATSTASADADPAAEAAAQSAANADASTTASTDSTTDANSSSNAAAQASSDPDAETNDDTNAEASTAANANPAAASDSAAIADSSTDASVEAAAATDTTADPDSAATEDADVNVNASASTAASASADDDGNPAAEAAADPAASPDADTTASAAADENAEAAAESAATEDASSETSADATTETNASATVAAEAASNADNTDAANADTNAAADADPAAAASVASNADSSSEASAAAAADADDSAVADASNESDVNANASASAAASANADNNDNAIAEAAAQAAATADADTTASAAADIDASAAAESAATEDSSSEASADATSDPNASAQAAATAAANADDSETANADTTAAADADPAAAASAASNADSSVAASAEAASSADADGAEAETSASADADPEASASADADADPEGAATAAADGAEAEATASADTDGAEASASSDDDADKASASADSDQAASASAGASSDSESSASSSSQSNASASSAGASTNASGSSNGGDLPRTGADGVLTMAGIAALLIAGGAAAIYGTRRYRASAGQH